MILPSESEERLSAVQAIYERAVCAYAPVLADLDRRLAQYRGDPALDGGGRASTVRNITYELIEGQVTNDIPPPKVTSPYPDEKHRKRAETIEALLLAERDRLPFEEWNDLDERFTLVFGASVWLVEWDGDSERANVRVLSPRDFVPEPGLCRVEDMEYLFVKSHVTREELARRYGIAEDAPIETGEDGIAEVTILFWRGEDGEIGKLVFSGDTILEDIPRLFHRKRTVCRLCGKEEGACECGALADFALCDTEGEDVFGGAEGDAFVPYYIPHGFPVVIRRNTSTEHTLFGQSDCDFIRHQQQAINRVESRILEKLLRAGVTPVMPEDATVTLNHTVFGQIIRTRPGESASQYGTVDTTPAIAQDIAEADRLYDQAKRLLGVSDAYLGISNALNESGYARSLQISQASGRLESKHKMKHDAYAKIDAILFSYYLAFSDRPIPTKPIGKEKGAEGGTFSRFAFLDRNDRTGDCRYDDAFLFSVDLNGASTLSRAELWEKNLENFRSGTLGDPKDPATLLCYWESQERAHYPYARENADHFRTLLSREPTKGEPT